MEGEEDDKIFEVLSIENPEKRREELAKCLRENRDSVNAYNDSGVFPLMLACQNGYYDCISLLLEAGADVNEEDSIGSTPLLFLFIERNLNPETRLLCLRLLLDHGANVYRSCRYFVTPLMVACQIPDIECVKEILKRGYEKTGIDRQKSDDTKLSSEYEDDDIDCIDHEAETALLHCLNSEKPEKRAECLKLLISAGARVNPVDDLTSRPLWYAIYGLPSSLELVEILLKAGANLIDKDLISAIDVLNADLIKLFVSKGISVETLDKFKYTPLSKITSDIGNGKELTDEKQTRIKDCMRALIEANANINASNKHQLQPIHSAVWSWPSFRFPAEFLISENCDLSRVTYEKLSACNIYRLEENSVLEILRFLYRCGLPSAQCFSFGYHEDEDEDEDADDIGTWLAEMASSPRSLMDQCKFSIRRVLGAGIKQKCPKLDIPEILKDIILLKNVLSDDCFD